MFLELKNINKTYGGRQVLHNINLRVEKGKFVSLLGQSGCGKTTLLRIIAGLEEADSGRILLEGKDITALPVQQRNIGIVFQNFALFPHMTVFDNIAFGLKMKKLAAKLIKGKVADALEKVNLLAKAEQNVCVLSGGEQQRVALARAIVTEPEILLLDEPLSNLDYSLRLQARAELKRLQNEIGITSMYVTHDQSEALALSDEIAVLNKGRIVQAGSPRDVYNNPVDSFSAHFVGRYNLFDKKQFSSLFGQAATGSDVMAILPEHLRLQKATRQTGVFIEDILFTGALTEYVLASGSQVFKAVSFAGDTSLFRKGECVSLSVSKEDIKTLEPLRV